MKHRIILAAALALPGIALADPYLGRCHMGECLFYDQVSRHIVGEGSAAVPGDLVLVSLRSAVADSPDADPATLTWEAPAPVQFFCSSARPAYRMPDGGYQGLDLVTPAGATTLVTMMYLHACHPEGENGGDPFTAATALGYSPNPMDIHADFGALTRP